MTRQLLKHFAKKVLPKSLVRNLQANVRLGRLDRLLAPYRTPQTPRPHGLSGELYVSLTSYPPRFRHLHLTLESLLNQSVKPDGLILWIAKGDAVHLPAKVKALTAKGLDIRQVDDVRSYKKLVFALTAHPEAFIATVDDDTFYKPDWLATLVDGYVDGSNVITFHRAHRFPDAADNDNALPPYATWEWDIQDDKACRPSKDLLPTGVGGILYPPHSLHPDVTDSTVFMALCPKADDLWFYWMARRAGSLYKKVGGVFDVSLCWPNSQESALFNDNATENDRQIQNLMAKYGNPTRLP